MESWSKERIRRLVREYPEYKDGRLTEKKAEEIVHDLHAHQEDIVKDFLKAEIRQKMVRMDHKGEVAEGPGHP